MGIPEGIFALAPEVMLLPASGSIMTLYVIVVPMEHDASYKLLFSHARMVEDLLRGFVHEAWVREVDFTSLERVSGSYVSEDLRDREDDMIWRVRWGADWLYIYLLLEFQATVDRYMAVRLMVYIGLLWQSLIQARNLSSSGQLPPSHPDCALQRPSTLDRAPRCGHAD